nr:unknown [Zea mays]
MESIHSPSKTSSIAERRGGFTLLKLPSLQKDLVLPPRVPSIVLPPRAPSSIRRTEDASDNSTNGVKQLTSEFCSEKCTGNSLSSHSETRLIERTDSNSEVCSNAQLVVYQWPSMGKLTTFARKDLDPKSVLIFVTSNAIRRGEAVKMVYVWVGGENESSKSVDSVDWQQVTSDFLHLKGLSNVLPVKVFKEHEAENLLELLNVS